MKIKPIWSGALLSADMSMTEIRHGVADIGLITPIYTRGGTHLLRTQTGFYSGADSIETQLALYRCMATVEPQFARELEGLKLLALQGGVLPGILTRSTRVEKLEDLRGLRIRAPTELLPVLRNLGADPVDLPMGEVYSALAKGVIDGVVAPPETLQSLHFGEVAEYFFDVRIPRGAYPSRAMDMEVWQSLSAAEKAILEESIAVWEDALADENRAAAAAGEKIAADTITITPATADDQRRFDDLYLREGEANARALSRVGYRRNDSLSRRPPEPGGARHSEMRRYDVTQQPLAGITVADFSHVMAGPFASHILRLMGATVIKIESPRGDQFRNYGSNREFDGMSPAFIAANVGKKSIALDLKDDKDHETAQRIVAQSDVLLENFRPGVIDRLGLGYDAVRKLREDIVFCSVSGYGQDGPQRDWPAIDNIVQATSGMMMLSGAEGDPPVRIGFPIVDTLTGQTAAVAILGALLPAGADGEGGLHRCLDARCQPFLHDLGAHALSRYRIRFAPPRQHRL